MAFSFTKHFRTRETPQSEPVPGLAMVPNSGVAMPSRWTTGSVLSGS